jgi:hypothetical protein
MVIASREAHRARPDAHGLGVGKPRKGHRVWPDAHEVAVAQRHVLHRHLLAHFHVDVLHHLRTNVAPAVLSVPVRHAHSPDALGRTQCGT